MVLAVELPPPQRRVVLRGQASVQFFAERPFDPSFDRLPDQFCRLLDRLPDRFCRLLGRLPD